MMRPEWKACSRGVVLKGSDLKGDGGDTTGIYNSFYINNWGGRSWADLGKDGFCAMCPTSCSKWVMNGLPTPLGWPLMHSLRHPPSNSPFLQFPITTLTPLHPLGSFFLNTSKVFLHLREAVCISSPTNHPDLQFMGMPPLKLLLITLVLQYIPSTC